MIIIIEGKQKGQEQEQEEQVGASSHQVAAVGVAV